MMGVEVGEAFSVLVEKEEAIAAEVFDKRLERGEKKKKKIGRLSLYSSDTM
jgi:hypothetical protein